MIKPSPLSFSAGWLAPDGRWFPCHPHQHDAIGIYLAKQERLRYNDLTEHDWVRVYQDGIFYIGFLRNVVLTQKQINALDQLAEIFEKEDPEYGDQMRDLLWGYLRKAANDGC
jgi:hypothetical protein